MADASAADQAETTEKSPAEAPDKKKSEPFVFKFESNGKFSIDYLLLEGRIESTIIFSKEIRATYRTMSAEEIQACEEIVDADMRQERTLKFLKNEMTIAQLYYSLVALNNKDCPPANGKYKSKKDVDASDPKREFVRNLAGPLFDMVVKGLDEFDRHAKSLITKDAVANF